MPLELMPYTTTICALGAMGALLVTQILVLDVASIRAKHPPGAPVAVDHGKFLFRATRAHANTNENIAAFILLALFGLLGAANPTGLGAMAWVYVAGRVGHMLFYYANIPAARSVAFGVGLAGLLGMLAVSLVGLCC